MKGSWEQLENCVNQARKLKDEASEKLEELKKRRTEVKLLEDKADSKTRMAQAEAKRDYVSKAVKSLFEEVGMRGEAGGYVEKSDDVELSLISASTPDKPSNRFSVGNTLKGTYVHALFPPRCGFGKVREMRGTVRSRDVVSNRTRTRKHLL